MPQYTKIFYLLHGTQKLYPQDTINNLLERKNVFSIRNVNLMISYALKKFSDWRGPYLKFGEQFCFLLWFRFYCTSDVLKNFGQLRHNAVI